MLYSDEAGERDLRVAKRYAPVTSTRQDASISESLKHELHQKFVQKKKKIPISMTWLRKFLQCTKIGGRCDACKSSKKS